MTRKLVLIKCTILEPFITPNEQFEPKFILNMVSGNLHLKLIHLI